MSYGGDIPGRPALSSAFTAFADPRPSKSRKTRLAPFSLRLSVDERARLERDARETPLATYIKFRLFNNLPELTRPRGSARRPNSETQLIAKLLAALGEARLANNLNQLAKHANMEDVRAMRRDLVAALGQKADSCCAPLRDAASNFSAPPSL